MHTYTYTLTLSEADVETIAFVGGRYAWSEALAGLEAGANELPEADAWRLREEFEADTEGGHAMFPLLGGGELKNKLTNFIADII